MDGNPRTHHIDRRAGSLIATPGDDNDLIDTQELAAWLGVSTQWCEIGRSRGFGPKFLKLGRRMVRYKRGDVIRWLKSRKRYASTREVR